MNAPITTTPAGDLLANIHELEWLDVGGGTQFKVLRICEKTGQFFILSGELIYDVGTAPAGTYGFEPVFAEHSDAHCVVETEMLFLGEGAVTYFTPEGDVDYVFNAMTLKAAQEGAAQIDLCPT